MDARFQGCRHEGPPVGLRSGTGRAGGGRDVLFVVVDCLRSDHVSRFGYERETTPFLDDLDAAAFPAAVTPAPWTFPSVASLLTGLYPHEHGARPTGDRRAWGDSWAGDLGRLPESVGTLADLLGEAGYRTFLRSAIRPAAMTVGDRFDRAGVNQHVPADRMARELLDWWTNPGHDRPRFAYVQFGDLHGWQDAWDADYREWPDSPFGTVEPVPDPETVDWTDPHERAESHRRLELVYDTQLRALDEIIERLLDRVSRADDRPDPLVVVCGDHGEALGEHRRVERDVLDHPDGPPYGVGHGRNLFGELLTVPLFFANAGAAGDDYRRVSTVDVLPTVCDLLDVDRPTDPAPSGRHLDHVDRHRPVYAEAVGNGYEQHAVYRGDQKLVSQPHGDVSLLYDLSTDPAERDPLDPADHCERVRSLERELAARDRRTPGRRVDPSADTRRRLAELGYLDAAPD